MQDQYAGLPPYQLLQPGITTNKFGYTLSWVLSPVKYQWNYFIPIEKMCCQTMNDVANQAFQWLYS